MCKGCKKKCCDCVVVIQKTPYSPPLPPPNPLYPPNADTLQQVIDRSCTSYSSSKRRKCSCVVKQLYIVANELQNAFRRVDASWISSFYSETAIVSFNGSLFVGKPSVVTGVIEPLISGFTSVNPDFTTLTYQVHNEFLVTQYGTFSVTSTLPGGATSTTTYNVIATWELVCDKWVIANEVLNLIVV